MRWCNVQTNEYDLQAKRYPAIYNTNECIYNNVYSISDRIWWNKHLRHTTTEKYENYGKGGYFRFDDDNNMSYRYILSVTYTLMGQLNTYSPIYCNENKR